MYVKTGWPRSFRRVLREPRRSGPQQIVTTYDGVTAEPFKAGNLLDFLLQRTWTVLWLGVRWRGQRAGCSRQTGQKFFFFLPPRRMGLLFQFISSFASVTSNTQNWMMICHFSSFISVFRVAIKKRKKRLNLKKKCLWVILGI